MNSSLALSRVHAAPASLDQLSTAVVTTDAQGTVVAANSSAGRLFGTGGVGASVAALIDDAEKLGRLLARRHVLPAPGATAMLETSDGRLIAAHCTLSGAEKIYEFTDVTAPVQTARNGQRDALTGLANRVAFRERLGEALAAGLPVAVLTIDLDRFKTVNDALGHPVGDALLKAVAERIAHLLGEDDVLARLGGDEFAILHPGDIASAAALAEQIVDIVGRAYLLRGHMANVGASVGVAVSPEDGTDPEQLIKRSDLAMFAAKTGGRGAWRQFVPEMDAALHARRTLELNLRRGMVLREFSLAYQPQVDLSSGIVVGFEALLRWTHEGAAVSPAQFIPLAEEIGLIVPIGEWVLRTACREAARWPAHVSISVNLSPVQFRGNQLVATVTSALAAARLPPHRLELEITEGALLANTDAVLTTLLALRRLGVRIAMDDFGTGYSSLSYLQKFPFDKIKIDQSFVRKMVEDKDSAAIVRAVAALGRSLGMTTIAEGVETDQQLAGIREHGCDVAQGYLTGRPMPPEAAAELAGADSRSS